MKITAISDLHGILIDDIKPCDILFIAGDITPAFREYHRNVKKQVEWLENSFVPWLKTISAKHIVVIAGNHDFIFETNIDLVPKSFFENCIYLQDSGCEIEGLKIWGSPHTPIFHNWAFNLYEVDLKNKFNLIPDDTDIIIIHGPPYGILDKSCDFHTDEEVHCGSISLLEKINKIKPKLFVCGHIHKEYGWQKLDNILFVNAAVVNERYNLTKKPILIENWEVIDSGKIVDQR